MDSSDSDGRERALRSAVLAGDEQAWRTWYEESFPGLSAYVSWRCAGWHDLADDVIQETWLTAVRRIRAFDPGRGSFVNWLRGIAANVLRNQLRRRVRQGRALPARNGTAGRPADETHRAEQIARALAALPEHYEAVLRAKYLEQNSVVEIAAARRESPKAVESLLTRARQAFRAAYLEQED